MAWRGLTWLGLASRGLPNYTTKLHHQATPRHAMPCRRGVVWRGGVVLHCTVLAWPQIPAAGRHTPAPMPEEKLLRGRHYHCIQCCAPHLRSLGLAGTQGGASGPGHAHAWPDKFEASLRASTHLVPPGHLLQLPGRGLPGGTRGAVRESLKGRGDKELCSKG